MKDLLGHRLLWSLVILFVLAGFVPCVLSADICGPEYYQLEKNFATKGNIDQLKEAFFPENNVPPLQIIITYRVVDKSMGLESPVWAWMWNPVYVFCGARFLAEFGLGLPIISMKHQILNFSQPFIKVKEINLNLTKLTNETSRNACIRKLTSLLKEFAKHENDTKNIQVAHAVFSYPYNIKRDLAEITSEDEVWNLHLAVTLYAVILSFFLLPLLYYVVKEYYGEVMTRVRESDTVWYGVFWGMFTFCALSNFYHTICYFAVWNHQASWAYPVFGEYSIVYHCIWWITASILQLLAASLFPKQEDFPFPRFFSIICCISNKQRVAFIMQTLVMWVFIYYVHILAQSAMFMALAIVADPVTSTTWIVSTLFLRVSAIAFFSSLFSMDRCCNLHDDIKLTVVQATKDAFHLFSWGVPFLGSFLLTCGFAGLTFMDKDTQPKYVSSIASFLLAPPILAFLGWLSRFFIRKLFSMVSSGNTPVVGHNGYTPITNDDVHIDSE